MNIFDLQNKKAKGEKLTMLTCYDYSFARILEKSSVDMLLVGDSVAMVMHGFENTLHADTDMMALHTRAVARGAKSKFIVSDIPFLANRKGLSEIMNTVEVLMKSGAQAIKMEGAKGNLEFIRHIVESGVPVMGHLGLTPQYLHQLGGYRVQGKDKSSQDEILKDAWALQDAGCFAIVLECVPAELAEKISRELKIPTIGIGAGPHCDGQVLVLQDMLGFNPSFNAKFIRRFLSGDGLAQGAIQDFLDETKQGSFPSEKESYL